MVTTERQERLAHEREEIEARVAKFKATQEKFQRERDEFFRRTWQDIDQAEPQPVCPDERVIARTATEPPRAFDSPAASQSFQADNTADGFAKEPGAKLRALFSLTRSGAYQ
jgi:hypothetical protein